nr:hypothetical protein CFP56_63030 [Quercus suber]
MQSTFRAPVARISALRVRERITPVARCTGIAYSTAKPNKEASTHLPASTQPRPPQQRLTSELLMQIRRQAVAMDQVRERAPPMQPPKSGTGDTLFILVTLGLLVATPAIIWAYWQYREEHMINKKKALLAQAQARHRAKEGA